MLILRLPPGCATVMLLPGQQTCLCLPATAPIPAPDTHPGRGPQSVWSGPCPRLRFRFTPFATFASPQFPRCITSPSHHGAFARASPSGSDFPDPYALLILPPSSPLVKLQHRFFRGPSLAHGTGYLLAQHYAFLCRPRCLQTRMCLRLMPGLPAPDAKATEGGQGLFCSS